jgi:hypothetical protein
MHWLHRLLRVIKGLPEGVRHVCWCLNFIIDKFYSSHLVFLLKSSKEEVFLFALGLHQSFIFDAIYLLLKDLYLVF